MTIKAARSAYPGRRLVMAFQPHRFSRTQALWDAFASILAQVDHLVLLDIYPGSEAPIDGIDAPHLAKAISEITDNPVQHVSSDTVAHVLPGILQHNDVVLFQGAGSVSRIARICMACFETHVNEEPAYVE